MKIKKVYIPGEHDWYLDMGERWTKLFGQPNWTFDHKGDPLRRARHREPRSGLLDGQEDVAQGADGAHGDAGRERRRGVGRRRP